MTFRLTPTPLAHDLAWPPARQGGVPAELLEACLPAPGLEETMGLLSHPEAVVVTTGQQPGLFTGPLYTVYKALSARALATLLSARWERPVVPLFWLAGDDHDFAEANHTAWLASDGTTARAALPDRAGDAPLTPMSRERLGPAVLEALDRLERSLPATGEAAETVAWLRRSYHPDSTVAGSFAAALAELLAPFGVVCFDSTHHSVKRASARIFMKAVGLAQDLDRDLEARARSLVAADADPRVAVGDGASLVMVEGRLGRDRLMVDGTRLVTRRSGEEFTLKDLHEIAAETPERLSPNVLLRPVLESALLPTVAYVAGPGELRYLPLAEPVYQRLRVPRQLPVPRWSGLVVEARVDRVLGKYGASLDELLAPGEALEHRVVRQEMPAAVPHALRDMRRAVEEGFGTLQDIATGIDPTLERAVLGAKHRTERPLHHIAQRLERHLKRVREVEMRQIGRAREAVLPGGKPQERVLTVASYLARFGSAFLDDTADAVLAWYAGALEGRLVPS